eukprot:TRINITY_DN81850_c0_g1_i1.p1 TRINITY_DN81850_c0_g1~~TRINITY_DN81850_c0_g1_i1.p1  ORF type:complete len:303 (-),score=39.32 TRINITY_DN81850_c0_g1_i1:101-1009(-)
MQRLSCIAGHVLVPQSTSGAASTSAESGAAAEPVVLYDVQGHVAVLTLNRARNRNAMTLEMLEGVREAGLRAARDANVRCIVIAGKGKNFCGGADLTQLGQTPGPAWDSPRVAPAGQLIAGDAGLAMYDHFLSLLDIPVPIVGALQGHAIGGGLGLAMCCDIRVCHSSSQYGANFVKLGLHPGMATTYFLPRLVGVPKATELLLTGRLVSGTEAERIGLATHVAATPEDVLQRAMEIAKEIAAAAPLAVRWTKRSIYQHLDWKPRAAAWDEANLQGWTFETQDFKEGAQALLQKRPPRFEGR